MKKDKLNFFQPEQEKNLGQWLMEQGISAGFPSPADDFKEIRISLDRELVKNGDATFYAKVSGDSMINAGLSDGDLIVIDRSLDPENNKIAVCFIDGDFTIKRIIYIWPSLQTDLCHFHQHAHQITRNKCALVLRILERIFCHLSN